MLLKLSRLAPALVVALVYATPAYAQKGGDPQGYDKMKMPTPEEIDKQVQDILAKAEVQTAELEGFGKLTYKAIPTSADEILKQLGDGYKDKIPKGTDITPFLNKFGPQVTDSLNKYLDQPEGWKFEAYADLKWKSKKIAKGEYKLTLVVDGEALQDLAVVQPEKTDEKGKKIKAVAYKVHFKTEKKQDEPFAKLKFELTPVEDKKAGKALSFDIHTEFFRTRSKTTEAVKLDPPKDPPKKDDAAKSDAGK